MSMQKSLRTIAEHKREGIHTVSPEDYVADVVDKMKEKNVGAMVVLDSGRAVVGIFSERDLLTRVVAEALDAKSTKVSAVMTSDPLCVDASMTVGEAMKLVTEQRIRHLPLTTGKNLEGLISAGDLMASALESQESEIKGLSIKLKKHKALIALIIGFVVLIVIGIAST